MRIDIKTQPDDVTCGPTSLQAVYRYFNDNILLEELIPQVNQVATGGTIAVFLGIHALSRGYDATLYVYNLDVFDPTWFYPRHLSSEELIEKLCAQLAYKPSWRIREATEAYCEFLKSGGKIQSTDLTPSLLKSYFSQKIPVITGLSATYLYRCAREVTLSDGESVYDDLQGVPLGHFVVLCGYDDKNRRIIVADPHKENPLSHDNYYCVNSTRLIHSIMLGTLTHDANMLIIKPRGKT